MLAMSQFFLRPQSCRQNHIARQKQPGTSGEPGETGGELRPSSGENAASFLKHTLNTACYMLHNVKKNKSYSSASSWVMISSALPLFLHFPRTSDIAPLRSLLFRNIKQCSPRERGYRSSFRNTATLRRFRCEHGKTVTVDTPIQNSSPGTNMRFCMQTLSSTG